MTTLKLFVATVFCFTLFASCKHGQTGLTGKWYIHTVENLETKEVKEDPKCSYIHFLAEGKALANSSSGREDTTGWRQSGDTLMIFSRDGKPYSQFMIDLYKDDTLVLTAIKPETLKLRLHLNPKCSAPAN